ncbi:ABC transporter permease [Palleronia sediminis]|uniref:ABC transporter permease n=1 Tax=Palleronia sediminis TaxID=2547833 RepID=A0A4R6AA50_9RHOB|nr:transglycosylase SLT domain-containing protein [Palleronia sediminis]TDL79732.1 ABC transporter permease [Palleronia sediminis]
MRRAGRIAGVALVAALVAGTAMAAGEIRPMPRPQADPIPVTRWDHRRESDEWSLAAISALKAHGERLVETDPRDIGEWCPGYKRGTDASRRAFWVGFLSALAKHESRWRPAAVGGGNRWFGLLQIWPPTARHFGCRARSGGELMDGADNLSCAIRIMSVTVPRDGVIHASSPRWAGVSADWGPMRSEAKREDMRRWLAGQDYCQISVSPRPMQRPVPEGLMAGPVAPETRPEPRAIVVASDDTPPARGTARNLMR